MYALSNAISRSPKCSTSGKPESVITALPLGQVFRTLKAREGGKDGKLGLVAMPRRGKRTGEA